MTINMYCTVYDMPIVYVNMSTRGSICCLICKLGLELDAANDGPHGRIFDAASDGSPHHMVKFGNMETILPDLPLIKK